MPEASQKPTTLQLAKVEPKPKPIPEPKWKKEFELSVEAFAKGLPQLGIRREPRAATIIYWMRLGDLRPLAAEIAGGKDIDPGVLRAFANLITESRLIVRTPGRRGAAKQPGLLARKAQMFFAFEEQRKSVRYEDALRKVADDFGVSPESVTKAVRDMNEIKRGNLK